MGIKIQLKDGRFIGLIRHGDPKGEKLFVFHGFPGSRNQFTFLKTNPTFANYDIIIMDRPGFGLSCPHPTRTLLGWAEDVSDIADILGINKFSVLGVSGGAPYALACSATLNSRVERLGIVCGLGPVYMQGVYKTMPLLARVSFALAKWLPGLSASFIWPFWLLFRFNNKLFFKIMAKGLNKEDKDMLKDETFFNSLSDSVKDSIINGLKPLATELIILSRPWGFSLEQIKHNVLVWHGDEDSVVPLKSVVETVRLIPMKKLVKIRGAGHYSAPINSVELILNSLVK